jgi:hypothetical protein
MGKVTAKINAGVCGFVTEVQATSEDQQHVSFQVTTPCENLKTLAEALPEADAYAELGAGFDGELHQAFRASLRGCCSGCVVPAGIFKAMQIAAGVALPGAISIEFERG